MTPKNPTVHKLLSNYEGVKAWLLKSYQLGSLMVQGAYFLRERKRLLSELGSHVFENLKNKEKPQIENNPLIIRIERLNARILEQEKLIQTLREGSFSEVQEKT